VRRQRFCRDLLYRGQAEQTHTATHEATGLTVKVRPDLMITSPKTGRRVIVDFKTTSAQHYAHFVATIEPYDYDRQAALYSDLLGAARFIIIGVQKKSPFEVWQFEVTPAPGPPHTAKDDHTQQALVNPIRFCSLVRSANPTSTACFCTYCIPTASITCFRYDTKSPRPHGRRLLQ